MVTWLGSCSGIRTSSVRVPEPEPRCSITQNRTGTEILGALITLGTEPNLKIATRHSTMQKENDE
jgi:hypothetical protein